MADLIHTVADLRARLFPIRHERKIIGLVPTMGALHRGHGRLIEQAVSGSGFVIVSIFVNPTQFNQADDYQAYPRDLAADLAFCEQRGVNLAFVPSAAEMYPNEGLTSVNVSRLTDHLCGPHRPGHFEGVATVVAKLLNIVQPDRTYFGEKDCQQLAIIRRMVEDLNMPGEIIGVPTVREPDGLALSSRNQRLSAEQRQAATVLYRALRKSEDLVRAGETCPGEVMKQGLAVIESEPLARAEYFEVVDPEQLQPLDEIAGQVLIAGAIWLGTTRLIDNLRAAPADSA
ncbi:MAG: pantoate--beta-alanine ligase [Acidobacteria bacterium]|nr:pantoate--beta-alanine ligase [Acidobacteriota bacterium]